MVDTFSGIPIADPYVCFVSLSICWQSMHTPHQGLQQGVVFFRLIVPSALRDYVVVCHGSCSFFGVVAIYAPPPKKCFPMFPAMLAFDTVALHSARLKHTKTSGFFLVL